MEKFGRENLERIQDMVQEKTGAAVRGGKSAGHGIGRLVPVLCCLLCFVALSAFAFAKFSGLNGDELAFASAYQGEGRFEIVVINLSDRELDFQDRIKVRQFRANKEVEGDKKKIVMSTPAIAPHSQGVITVDLSKGYDVEAMKESLPENDWYYFVLTNNNFAFGQDWMCDFDFEIRQTEDIMDRYSDYVEQIAKKQAERQEAEEKRFGTGELMDPDWSWPTVSRQLSGFYGRQNNGKDLDHVNIAGEAGDEIYAVADGVVVEAAFDSAAGNYLVLDLGGGVTVKYGHLQKTKVSEGDEVKQCQVIGTMGKTGMAAGPNLLFAVTVDGETVNPLAAEQREGQE